MIKVRKNLNEEKGSESEGNIVPTKKHSRLIVLSGDEEEIY